MDGDIDTAYALLNGQIDDANIRNGAGIVYGKLNLTGGIVNADIAVGAAIDGAKLADNSVDTLQLKDDAVTTVKIADGNVSLSKLGPDARSHFVSGGLTAGLAVVNAEQPLVTLPALTTNGGIVDLSASLGAAVFNDGVGIKQGAIAFRWYQDGVLIADAEALVWYFLNSSESVGIGPAALPAIVQPVSGLYTFELRAVTDNADIRLQLSGTKPGTGYAKEII